MLMYAQQVRRIAGTCHHEAIVDVETISDHAELRARYAPDMRPERRRRPSMIRLRYETKGQSGMREGTWYDLPVDIWDGSRYRDVAPTEAGSTFLRAVLEGQNNIIHFPSFRTSQNYASLTTIANLPDFFNTSGTSSRIRLDVVDCGHGNWNQVYFDDATLIYDTGACQSFTSKQVRALVKGRAIAKGSVPVYVVISHWDVDHYQALQRFTKRELQKIACVYVPSQVPDTATYKSIKARLDSENVPILALAPAGKVKLDRTIELVHIASPGHILVFRASAGHSRNQTGIALGIIGTEKNALLTGDHHYPKLLNITHHLPPANPLVLVAPHHGGHAGKLDAQAWLNVFSAIETPISCGTNNWDHPYPAVTSQLSLMQGKKIPPLTKVLGTQTFWL
jgi:beta-lactamase superfamily II metal-dependent hydrolase